MSFSSLNSIQALVFINDSLLAVSSVLLERKRESSTPICYFLTNHKAKFNFVYTEVPAFRGLSTFESRFSVFKTHNEDVDLNNGSVGIDGGNAKPNTANVAFNNGIVKLNIGNVEGNNGNVKPEGGDVEHHIGNVGLDGGELAEIGSAT